MVRKKEFRLKRFISLKDINLSRQKQCYRSYLFDKSWSFYVKHVIYGVTLLLDATPYDDTFTHICIYLNL